MRYNVIREMDIANGPGVRVSIFLQGCEFNCPKCFNPETHDFNGGKEFKEKFGNAKDVWVWTGYKFENIDKKEKLKYIDILVDGQYVDELHNPKLNWRGSSNQRILDVKESLKQGKPIEKKELYETINM